MNPPLTPLEKRIRKAFRRAVKTADLTGRITLPAIVFEAPDLEIDFFNNEIRSKRCGVRLTNCKTYSAPTH